jgi:hypothetical protein
MRKERAIEPLDAKLFRVRECQKSLDRACGNVGADRITHHHLRYLFATPCIESGVDIPHCLALARTQGRRGVSNENLWPLAPRAQPYPGAARECRADATKQADVIAFPATA